MARLDFIAELRKDHRKVRDRLLDLIGALGSKDFALAREILAALDVMVGPHFRFEEEHLYPALRVFLGDHLDRLVKEHDEVIETARSCVELLRKATVTDEEARQVADAARAMFVHVSNCDGLLLFCELLEPAVIDELSRKVEAAREAGVPLLEWASSIRQPAAA